MKQQRMTKDEQIADWQRTATRRSAENRALKMEIDQLRDALADCASGLRYIKEHHGELYGVGWGRSLGKADACLTPNAGHKPRGEAESA